MQPPALRISTLEELLLYCRRVAGSVGVLSIHVFGASLTLGLEMALQLGQAFQLTNILRDILEDANLNRLYLPQSLLRKHNVSELPLPVILNQPGVAAVCKELAALANESYSKAEHLIKQLNWLRMRPPVLMKAVYKPMLQRLEQRGWHRLNENIKFGPVEKLWRTFRHSLS